MEDQTITWFQILQVAGLAGVISALVNSGVRELLEQQERKRKARYLALRISLVLEGYYGDCVKRVYDIENYRGSSGNAGENSVGLPELSDYPSDSVEWMYLEPTIADEVLSFPAAIRAINDGIYFDVYMDSMPDGPDPIWTLKHLYEMVFRTIGLARRIRQTHGLSKTNRTQDSEARLKELQQHYLNEVEAERERDRKNSL